MKRVRYLAGAIGLATPAALGLTAPAHAASASPATGQCNGNSTVTIPHAGNVKGHGWYRTNLLGHVVFACIGTVDVSLYFTKGSVNNPFCKSASLALRRSPIDRPFWDRQHQVCGDDTHWFNTQFNVQQSWSVDIIGGHANPISVCARSTYHAAYTCGQVSG